MKNLVIFGTIALLVIVCESSDEILKGPPLYITGDELSVGAEIYVDGVKVGEMVEQIYTGPESKSLEKGDKFAFGRKLINKGKDEKKDYKKYSYIHISMGHHKIKFISKDGEIMEKEIEVKGDTYLAIDFQEMTIGGNGKP